MKNENTVTKTKKTKNCTGKTHTTDCGRTHEKSKKTGRETKDCK